MIRPPGIVVLSTRFEPVIFALGGAKGKPRPSSGRPTSPIDYWPEWLAHRGAGTLPGPEPSHWKRKRVSHEKWAEGRELWRGDWRYRRPR